MAGLKPFYLVLAGIAIVGGGAIFFAATRGGGDAPRPVAVAAPADSAALPGWVLGSEDAPVEIEEYADFQCPSCRYFAIVTMPDVRERLIATGRVRWRFRDFPLEGHPKSPTAHEAAACAGEQGRFWEMHDYLYYKQEEWVSARNTDRTIRDYARSVGLDLDRYDGCVASDRYLPRLAASAQAALARGINSTPTLVLRGVALPEGSRLPYDRLKAIVDSVAPPRGS